MNENHKIPQNWEVATVGQICENLQYGYTTSSSVEPCGPKFLRITDIQNGNVQWSNVPYCLIESGAVNKYLLKKNDILFARTGGTVGKSFIVSNVPEMSVFASYLIRLSAHSEIAPKYLYYFFQSASYWEQIGLKKGGLQGNVNATTLSSLTLLICPLQEQHRIVAKIEELFSELDQGVKNLKTAQAQLKVYRQALLKQAFEGKLTEQWRRDNQDQLESASDLQKRIQEERSQRYQQQLQEWEANGKQGTKPRASKELAPLSAEEIADLTSLPEGWSWHSLGDFIYSIDAGKSFKCDEREPLEGEVGVAKVSAITWGEYDESESKTCMDISKENDNYLIRTEDFILSRANTIDLVGACVIAKKVTKRIMLSDKTLRISFLGFPQEYFLQYLRCRLGRRQIMNLSTGNQESMRNIGQDRIRSILIPMCSTVESIKVLDILSSKLSNIDQLELTITTALKQSEALRQSILKKAFSGQLVAQDANDEPASVLLERIKIEKQMEAQALKKSLIKGARHG